MPHGKIWTGYVMGSCKEWCSETIDGIFADSLEDYKLYRQNKLTPDLGKELEDMMREYCDASKLPFLQRIKRKFDVKFGLDIELERNCRLQCKSCGHYYKATHILVRVFSYWPQELEDKWHRATCPYCGESDAHNISNWGGGHQIELNEL